MRSETGEREAGGASALMYVRCAYCRKWVSVKAGAMNRITHGICDACYRREMAALEADWPAGEDKTQ